MTKKEKVNKVRSKLRERNNNNKKKNENAFIET